jgi:hypothetical protein
MQHNAPRLSRDKIEEYLAHLGLDHVDSVAEEIGCWASLQAFVMSKVSVRPLTKPASSTRLRTYGLDQSHPVRMFIRHVIY